MMLFFHERQLTFDLQSSVWCPGVRQLKHAFEVATQAFFLLKVMSQNLLQRKRFCEAFYADFCVLHTVTKKAFSTVSEAI